MNVGVNLGLSDLMSQITGKMNVGVSAISVLFVIGLLLFRKAMKMNEEREKCE